MLLQMTRRMADGLVESDLWHRYRDRVYRYLLRLVGQQQTAEDLTQETFLQIIRDLRRNGVPGTHEAAWVMRIATNRAMDHFRRQRRFKWLPFHAETLHSSTVDTAESVAQKELVLSALHRLPPETAALLLLRDVEGFAAPEIGEMLEIAPEAVRKRLSRAREAFRVEYLRQKGEAP